MGDDLLAALAGLDRSGSVGAPPAGVAGPARAGRAERLVARQHATASASRRQKGAKTGPNPTDRGKRGSKYHVLIEGTGIPLAAVLTAANVNDTTMLEAVLDAVLPIHGRRGAPRRRPAKLHADKGYASKKNRAACYPSADPAADCSGRHRTERPAGSPSVEGRTDPSLAGPVRSAGGSARSAGRPPSRFPRSRLCAHSVALCLTKGFVRRLLGENCIPSLLS